MRELVAQNLSKSISRRMFVNRLVKTGGVGSGGQSEQTMKFTQWLSALILSSLLLVGPGLAEGANLSGWQQLQVADEEVQLKLETAAALPGEKLTIPIYLMLKTDVEVGYLAFDVSFTGEFLSFDSLEPGTRALEPIADIFRAEPMTVEGGGSRLRIEITNQVKSKVLPAGPLGYVIFNTQEAAEPGGTFDLKVENLEVRTTADVVVQSTRGSGTDVFILDPEEPPISACFFYMH